MSWLVAPRWTWAAAAGDSAPSGRAPAGSPGCRRRARPRRARRRRRARRGTPRRSRPPRRAAPRRRRPGLRQRRLRVEHRLQVDHQAGKATQPPEQRGARVPTMSADADGAADDGAGAGALPDRAAHDRRRPRGRRSSPACSPSSGTATCSRSATALTRRATSCPTFRGQNEQGMALAAVGLREGHAPPADHGRHVLGRAGRHEHGHGRRRRARRTGCRCCCSRATRSRAALPDPVLQQVEHFGDAVDDRQRRVPAGRRATGTGSSRPGAAAAQSLPHAVATMLDPADCGPAFLGLPQDVQAEAYDFPAAFFEPRRARSVRAARPDAAQLADGGGAAARRPSGR